MFTYLRELFNGVEERPQTYEVISVDDPAARRWTAHRRWMPPPVQSDNDMNIHLVASESSNSESDDDREPRFRDMPIRMITRAIQMENGSNNEDLAIESELTNVDSNEAIDNNVNDDDDVASDEDKERKKRSINDDDICFCGNCPTVQSLSECAVCLEPLQIRGVTSCTTCANLVCSGCASRLNKCAFCRSTDPMQRNRAIERLLGKMRMPCRNSKNGCDVLLKADSRLAHEARCDFALPVLLRAIDEGLLQVGRESKGNTSSLEAVSHQSGSDV